MSSYFLIWTDSVGQYRLTVKSGNNETIFTTEGYKQKATVENAIRIIMTLNAFTSVVDRTKVYA